MIFWTKRRKLESLLAASLYEPLTEAEQQVLDRALAADPQFCREAESLKRVRLSIRVDAPEFTGDLVPLLHARLVETAVSPKYRVSVRWVSAASLGAAVSLVLLVSFMGVPGGLEQRVPGGGQTASQRALSPVQTAISSAKTLMTSRDFAGARTVLSHALVESPDDPAAGAAQELVASLEFSEFQRYPEAYDAYERLRTRYPNAFMNNPECVRRFNLLDEVRRSGYAPMYALDAIRNHPRNAFEQCERLMAQYPESLVASIAMNEMRGMVGLPGQLDGPSHVLALERVRNRCSDPAAVAQVTLALGNACRDDLCDAVRARMFYNEAASSGHMAVATRAQDALARLTVGTP